MKLLRLSNSSLSALIDDEDFERCSRWTWSLMNGKRVESHAGNLSNFVKQDFLNVFDHKNRNIRDNQKDNLRPCSRSQNQANRAKFSGKNSSSQYKGVIKRNRRKPYKADICVNNQRIYLGSFYTEILAAKAYDNAAKEYFGEFAVLNFPKEDFKI